MPDISTKVDEPEFKVLTCSPSVPFSLASCCCVLLSRSLPAPVGAYLSVGSRVGGCPFIVRVILSLRFSGFFILSAERDKQRRLPLSLSLLLILLLAISSCSANIRKLLQILLTLNAGQNAGLPLLLLLFCFFFFLSLRLAQLNAPAANRHNNKRTSTAR